ncbi:MAG: hypothetical protein H6810_08365 [Phycisphaeraceae bacterium]|nr:MAG: hypothetical protein H6810_08365 [Phycisphaeraceae bacterium]
MLVVGLVSLALAAQPSPPPDETAPPRAAVNVLELGAIADGQTDCAPAIQKAIDRVSESGGDVIIPAAEKPYLIRSGLTISADGVSILGDGATIRFADNAMNGEIVDCIRVLGTPGDPVEHATIRGLTIDANYWAQPGSYDPRGIDSDYATGLVVQSVTITNAFVGLTFGRGVSDSEAVECLITRWYDDAFNASGDGFSGSCHDIRFTRCTAKDSPDERAGGRPGARNNAWAIEDGAHDITIDSCTVQDCGGNGFAVRNHASDDAVATTAVRFVNCRADNVAGNAFFVFGRTFPNTIESIALDRCTSDSACVFSKDIRGLTITASKFPGTVTIGPVDNGQIRGSEIGWLRVWSTDVGVPNEPGGYRTSITFDHCTINHPASVFGNRNFVRFIDE